MEDQQEENLDQVKKSCQNFHSKAEVIEKEGQALLNELQGVLNKIEAQRVLNKIQNKYEKSNN